MSWPLSQDYNEAIQSPAANFSDPDLKRGQVVCNALGLPMPFSGNFADVYQVKCPDGSRWAVKCFTREAHGLRERYQEISKHLRQAKLPFTVDFSYLEQGIRIAGKWYPVLKMQWVEGLTLNQFVSQYLDKPAMLEALLQLWARMGKYLRAAEIGHCDLQHGNVLLVPGATPNSLLLKLIDYDGMWVPALAGNKSGEVGHANYQHPRRLSEGTYSLEVDRFPLLLVATAMRALKADKELWAKYDDGDNMLFKESDLAAPAQSELFQELASLPDPGLVMLAAQVRAALKGPLESAALVEDVMPDAKGGPAPAKPARSATAAQATAPKPKAVPVASPVAVSRAASAPAADALAFDAAGDAAVSSFIRKRDRSKGIHGGKRGVPVAVWVGGGVALIVLLALAGGLAVWALGGTPSAPPPTSPDKRLAQKDPAAPPPRDVKPDPVKNKTPTPVPPPDDPPADPVVPPKPPADPVVPVPPVEPPAGQPVRELFTVADHGSGPIRVLGVSRDGKQGISLDANKLLQRFSLKDGAKISSNSLGLMAPQAAALLPGGERVLLGCKDGSLRILDMVNPQQTPPFKVRGAAGPAGSVAWVDLSPDPDGAQALSCGDDGSIFLWDVKKGEEIRHWKGSDKPITSVRFSPDGKSAVSCGQDETAHLWNLANGHETGKIERVRPDNAGKPLTAVFLSPDTALVGFTTTSGHWDIKNNHSTSSFGGGANRAVAGSQDGRLTAFAADNATEFIVLDEKKAGVFWPCRGLPSIAPECLVFAPDGRHILAGCLDGTIHYWEVNGVPPAPGQQAPDTTITNSIGMKLVLIPAGKFTMGSPKEEPGRAEIEGPQHEVEITRSFYMGAYPVTRGQFAAFVAADKYKTQAEADGQGGSGYNTAKKDFEGKLPIYTWRNTGFLQTDEHPVINVTWNDAVAYCAWLSMKEGKTYELPTEAEWEYACRAGTKTRFWCGETDISLKGNANLKDASFKERAPQKGEDALPWDDGYPFTSPVGKFHVNPWGLYDMHGNVWQWCADWYGKYDEGYHRDPTGPQNGNSRVLHGGSFSSDAKDCRSAARYVIPQTARGTDVGFRIILRQAVSAP